MIDPAQNQSWKENDARRLAAAPAASSTIAEALRSLTAHPPATTRAEVEQRIANASAATRARSLAHCVDQIEAQLKAAAAIPVRVKLDRIHLDDVAEEVIARYSLASGPAWKVTIEKVTGEVAYMVFT